MHTGGVTRRPTRALRGALLGVLLCAALVGCSDDSSDPDGSDDSSGSTSESGSESGSPTPAESLLVPDGVELTDQGSSLEVGETATVAYEVRQGVVGVLDLTVTRLEKTSFEESFVGWDLSAETKEAKPYFVRASVTNRGETDLGGLNLQPLYIVDGNNTLVEATSFASKFKPCEPGLLPEPFAPGASVDLCLVYLSPDKGDLTAVSWRPTEEDVPITWTGELVKPEPPKGDKDKEARTRARARATRSPDQPSPHPSAGDRAGEAPDGHVVAGPHLHQGDPVAAPGSTCVVGDACRHVGAGSTAVHGNGSESARQAGRTTLLRSASSFHAPPGLRVLDAQPHAVRRARRSALSSLDRGSRSSPLAEITSRVGS